MKTYVMDADGPKKRFVKGSVPVICCSVMRGTRRKSDPRQTVGRAGHV